MINKQNEKGNAWIFMIIIIFLVIIVMSLLIVLFLGERDEGKITASDSVLPEGESTKKTDEGNIIVLETQEEIKTEEEEIKEKAFLIVDKAFIDIEPIIRLEDRLIYTDYPNAILKKVWAVRYKKDYMRAILIFDATTGEFLFSEGF